MLPRTSSIWQRNSQPMASGKPGAVQLRISQGYIKARLRSRLAATQCVHRVVLLAQRIEDCKDNHAPPHGLKCVRRESIAQWFLQPLESIRWNRGQFILGQHREDKPYRGSSRPHEVTCTIYMCFAHNMNN